MRTLEIQINVAERKNFFGKLAHPAGQIEHCRGSGEIAQTISFIEVTDSREISAIEVKRLLRFRLSVFVCNFAQKRNFRSNLRRCRRANPWRCGFASVPIRAAAPRENYKNRKSPKQVKSKAEHEKPPSLPKRCGNAKRNDSGILAVNSIGGLGADFKAIFARSEICKINDSLIGRVQSGSPKRYSYFKRSPKIRSQAEKINRNLPLVGIRFE